MATFHKTKSGCWVADIRSKRKGEKLLRLTRTFDTKGQAQAWAKTAEAQIKEMRTSGRLLPTTITMGAALALWRSELQDYIDRGQAKRHPEPHIAQLAARVNKEKSRTKLWSEHALAALPLRDITQLHVEAYIDDRRDDDIADSTVNNDLNLLNGLFSHAAAASSADAPTGWRWNISNPIVAAKKARTLKQSRKRSRRLSSAEFDALRGFFARMRAAQLAAPADDPAFRIELNTLGGVPARLAAHDSLLYIEAAFEAAIECALRREKLFAMTWRWVDMSTLYCEHISIPPELLGPDNKGVPAYLAMSPRLVEILKTLQGNVTRIGLALDESVFGPLLADRAYRLLKVACDALGIEDFRWHDLRHEACSRLAEGGWTLPEIQLVSGHKTLQSLERYIHLNKKLIHAKYQEDEDRKAFETFKLAQRQVKLA